MAEAVLFNDTVGLTCHEDGVTITVQRGGVNIGEVRIPAHAADKLGMQLIRAAAMSRVAHHLTDPPVARGG